LKLKIAEHCCSISFFKLCHISHENENDNGMPVQKKKKKEKKKENDKGMARILCEPQNLWKA
jgi:hypothetical protein